ncbi:hypothetical protein TCAL_14913 [Tigriopus californicus]|uniref:Uncharacterized protein n=1 Tax=Tigriopus californicus TaxID=6832 RepID=A0A553P277_TIGCA|nr:transmembrane protein 18-like [Tigriopus californicus]TRY71784.1 hypothetical protein TCAL_14913 [Tigriopus californicus]
MTVEPIATDEIKSVYTYLASLDWEEPWLFYLIGFHLFVGLVAFFTRRIAIVQATIFCALLLTVYQAEDINAYCAQNHKLFTAHQYFDSHGLFISIVMSMPFLGIAASIVANWFYVSTQLMRDLRVQKDRVRERQTSKKDQ